MKPSPKQIKEAHKNYEKVVEHLISEGYANDRDAADNIIKGMSEEWFNLIVD
jgi:SOS response regulatory protein OraA/RecX